MATFINPCGGKRWAVLASGLIEIEGEGTPTVALESGSFRNLVRTSQNWGSLLGSAAARHGVPVSWLLAIATMETGAWSQNPAQQASIVSPAGAIGVMQIMPFNAAPFGLTGPEELTDPVKNIEVGAKMVAKINGKHEGGLPAISAVYNSGRLCGCARSGCNEWNLVADSNYPRRVIEWNNTAIEQGLVGLTLGRETIAALGAAFGAAVALAAAGVGARPLRGRGT